METASARRRRKLQDLCERHGRLAVATRAQVSSVALEQILKGVLLPEKADGTRSPRSLGDKAARAIEEAFDLGLGWFDAPDADPTVFDSDTLDFAARYQRMTAEQRSALRSVSAAFPTPVADHSQPNLPGMNTGFGDLEEEQTHPKRRSTDK